MRFLNVAILYLLYSGRREAPFAHTSAVGFGLRAGHAGPTSRLTDGDVAADNLFDFARRARPVVDQDLGAGSGTVVARCLMFPPGTSGAAS